MTTLLQTLAEHARTRPDKLAAEFPGARGYTYAQLARAVLQLAGYLQRAGIRRGARLAIIDETPHAQALGFLAGMACSAMPSILSYPSIKQSPARFGEMLNNALARGGTTHVVCSPGHERDLRAAGITGVELVVMPELAQLDRLEPGEPIDASDASEVAFLQYSSGTTGLRKGVAITHDMLRVETLAYASAIGFGEADTVVSWLPLYHDMGLLACLLIPLHFGATCVHMSPFEWLREPGKLLRLTEQHQATLLFLPNFAYRYLAERVPADDRSSLASVRATINSGEPVRPHAHDAFLARFGPAGIRPTTLQTSYGLAENTFAVTQTPPGSIVARDRIERQAFLEQRVAVPAPSDADVGRTMTVMSSGRPLPGYRLRIRLANRLAGEREVGEIEVTSPALFSHYEPLGSSPPPLTADGWFATGDLGYLVGDELFVTGRISDMIIHRGANFHPEDIEDALLRVPGGKPGRAVAFGVWDEAAGTEIVVAMIEAERADADRVAMRRDARTRVFESLGLTLSDVMIVDANTLLKSTSGKLSRRANRELYVANKGAKI